MRTTPLDCLYKRHPIRTTPRWIGTVLCAKIPHFPTETSFPARNLRFIRMVVSLARFLKLAHRGETGGHRITARCTQTNREEKEMRSNLWTGRLSSAILAGAALIAVGCQESTTNKDVANARKDVREEQQQTAETVREAQKDVAEARRDAQPYSVNKPVTDKDAADARQDVANAQHEAQQDIAAQKENEREAVVELKTVEQQAAATKARDAFVAETQQQLANAEARINQLKTNASAAEGANKETIDRQIDTLQNQHDRAEEALGNLKSAKLAEWQVHRQHVRVAVQDLNNSMNNVR
jgi:chromosome segregation ATPase